MGTIVNVILAVQMLTALAMIGLILIQHGKGADMGAALATSAPSAPAACLKPLLPWYPPARRPACPLRRRIRRLSRLHCPLLEQPKSPPNKRR